MSVIAEAAALRSLHLSGTPREMGRAHGEELRVQIHETMARWREALAVETNLPFETYVQRFLTETNFKPAIHEHAPELLDEIHGIAEGAGVADEEMFAYQLIDEQWLFTARMVREEAGTESHHCTVVGVFDQPGSAPVLAQNMDIPKFYDGSQTLLFIDRGDSRPRMCVWTVAGLIGAMGVNLNGIGVCCNTVSQLAWSTDGLPVAFVVRKILESSTRAEAITFVRSVKHASGQNYTIGGQDGITSLECSATRCEEFTPSPGRVFHTNHPVVNDDLQEASQSALDSVDHPAPIPGNSELRFQAVESLLQDSAVSVGMSEVIEILSDPESLVCVTRDGNSTSFTATCMVAELTAPPVVRFAPGPSNVTPFITFDLAQIA